MAKNLLQDMVKKKAPLQIKRPAVRIPVKTVVEAPPVIRPEFKIPEKSPERIIEKPVEKVYEPVNYIRQDDTPRYTPPAYTPPVSNQPSKRSETETKFASVYDGAGESDAGGGRSKSRYSLWFVAGACVLFLLFALSLVFSGAKITITPKVKDVASNVNLSANKDGTTGDLPFQLVVLSGEETKTVPAGAEKAVSIKATGKAVIYNGYSSAAQPLAIDTRLEGSNGKIYKTLTKTTVPGMKGSTPGSVEVTIYGTDAGADYNSSPLDFKIFGFKGTPKYTKFYARSDGPISGGLVGKSSDITDAEKIQITADLKSALKDKLFGRATDQIPAGFILWKDSSILDVPDGSVAFTPNADNTVTADMKGTFSGFLFEQGKITAKIASKDIPDEDTSNVYIQNIRDLTFTFSGAPTADTQNINFNLSGNTQIVWNVDADKVVTDLLGQKKSDFNNILAKYPNVDSAQLVIQPFWKMSFPDKAQDIKVTVNYPK